MRQRFLMVHVFEDQQEVTICTLEWMVSSFFIKSGREVLTILGVKGLDDILYMLMSRRNILSLT